MDSRNSESKSARGNQPPRRYQITNAKGLLPCNYNRSTNGVWNLAVSWVSNSCSFFKCANFFFWFNQFAKGHEPPKTPEMEKEQPSISRNGKPRNSPVEKAPLNSPIRKASNNSNVTKEKAVKTTTPVKPASALAKLTPPKEDQFEAKQDHGKSRSTVLLKSPSGAASSQPKPTSVRKITVCVMCVISLCTPTGRCLPQVDFKDLPLSLLVHRFFAW